MATKHLNFFNAGVIVAVSAAAYLSYALLWGDQTHFLPGATTSGHYQIEEKCDVCHVKSFSSRDDLDKACIKCHGQELKDADDSHPASLFNDPRNADQLAILDARYCVTCHREHKPKITHAMGVTVPSNNCISCHKDIAQVRPTHLTFGETTCDSAGCHNYHDNRALYEEFLLKHRGEPAILPHMKTGITASSMSMASQIVAAAPLASSDAAQQQHSAHGRQQIACGECHGADAAGQPKWQTKPSHEACKGCHVSQVEGFLASKYGMRPAQKLPAMTPGAARQPVHKNMDDVELGCNICHKAHQIDIRQASVEACLTCHNDPHSLAYKSSAHYRSWLAESAGNEPAGNGVSCATCHMPRETIMSNGLSKIYSQHNLNDNLRPNEKMIRNTCMSCHGLSFAIDALADASLIANNFNRLPGAHVKSMEMAESHVQKNKVRP